MYVGGRRLGKLVLLNGRFYLVFHHNSQDPSREAQLWWSHHLWDYIVLSRLDILQINCVVPVMEEHFPKWVHSPKEHSRAPCFQPYYHCGERASYPQRGCNGYFLPTPMTHYSVRPSWWKMPTAHYAGLFSYENLGCQDTSAGVDHLYAFSLTLRNMNLKLHLRMN